MRVGAKMADRFWLAMAVGLLFATHAQAQDRTAVHGAPSRPVELSEAFPWDEPVEQTFTVDSVLRWRRGMPAEGKQQHLIRADSHHERLPIAVIRRRFPRAAL